MKIKKLPIDPGPAGWNAILPHRNSTNAMEGTKATDWLIIGGGFAGLSAARRITQLHPKDDIVLLEAKQIAEGPSGRNSGFMIDLPHNLASGDYLGETSKSLKEIQSNRTAINFAKQMAKDFNLPSEALRNSGKLNAAATAKGSKHNKDYARHLYQMNEPYELLDAAQMASITGSNYYLSGLYTPGTAILQPAMFVRGVAEALSSNGVKIYENSPVIALDYVKNWVVQTPGGSLTAPKVILAVNGHANSFGFFKKQLMHVFTYASMTRALTKQEVKILGGQPNWAATPADPLGTTVRRVSGAGGDRIIIRNRASFDPSMEVSEARIQSVGNTHDSSFRDRFPMLKNVTMEFRWGGRLCLSRNSVAAFGEIAPGLFSACCQNGLGTAKGTLHGMLAAELASEHSSDLLSNIMTQAEPKRLPPGPIAWLGANALLKWGEFKAGADL